MIIKDASIPSIPVIDPTHFYKTRPPVVSSINSGDNMRLSSFRSDTFGEREIKTGPRFLVSLLMFMGLLEEAEALEAEATTLLETANAKYTEVENKKGEIRDLESKISDYESSRSTAVSSASSNRIEARTADEAAETAKRNGDVDEEIAQRQLAIKAFEEATSCYNQCGELTDAITKARSDITQLESDISTCKASAKDKADKAYDKHSQSARTVTK